MNNSISKIRDTLALILKLQKESNFCNDKEDCTKPFLGPENSIICYNTRPITLYSCCTGNIWSMPYTLNGQEGTSTIFRIEKLDGDCATFRILVPNITSDIPSYTLTQSSFTIDLSCIMALQCLNDASVI